MTPRPSRPTARSFQPPTLDRKIAAGLAVAFALILIGAVSTWRAESGLRDAQRWVAHTPEVLAAIEATTSGFHNLVLRQRGFALTGTAEDLRRFETATAALHPVIRRIRGLTSDNPWYESRIPQLDRLADEEIAFCQRVVTARQRDGFETALALVQTGQGLRILTRATTLLDEMRGEERLLLRTRSAGADTRGHVYLAILGVGLLIQVALLAALYALARRDAAERHREALVADERTRLATFAAEVGGALTRRETLPDALEDCARAMINHLGASTSSVWTLDDAGAALDLQGAAGFGTTLPDFVRRVPLGRFRLGRIAVERRPMLTALDREQPQEDDRDWARNRGMISFIGYPLIVRGRVVGVLSMFADHHFPENTLSAIGAVADEIALAVDRARASEALGASEARARSIMDNMLVGLVTSDRNGVVESLNPATERIFGYSADEIVGKPLAGLMVIPPDADATAWIQEAHRKSIGRVTEWEARRKNGEVFPMELALFAFESPGGRRYAGSLRDLSEKREVDRLKKEFVSTVSHELRTPLTSIRGSLGLLSGGALGALPPEASEMIAIAERNVVRLVGLVGDILDLERIDGGRLELHLAPVAVVDLVRRSVEAVRGFAEESGIPLETTDSSASVVGDADRLVQVLVNLLSNAIKFSPRGAAVTLSVVEEPGAVVLRLRDRGRGIPASHRETIFERFRQVHGSDAREKGGTGLGLTICREIVHRHGGSIGVDSAEGAGSTFWVRLRPAAPASVETEPSMSRSSP